MKKVERGVAEVSAQASLCVNIRFSDIIEIK